MNVTNLRANPKLNEALLLAESALIEAWSVTDDEKAWEHLNELPDVPCAATELGN